MPGTSVPNPFELKRGTHPHKHAIKEERMGVEQWYKERDMKAKDAEIERLRAELANAQSEARGRREIDRMTGKVVVEDYYIDKVEQLEADNKRLREGLRRWMKDTYDPNASMTTLISDTKKLIGEGRE